MKHPLRPLLLCCLLFATSLRAEEFVVTFDVTEERETANPKGAAPSRETRRYLQTVALGENHLVIQNERQKTVHDFARRRMIVLNRPENTYDDWSLYSLPAFLEHEIANRVVLGGAMKAAGVAGAAALFDRFDAESELRTEARGAPPGSAAPVIETAPAGDALEFRHESRTVARFAPADTALPEPWRHRFVNYLAYGCALHPRIRAAIAERQALPRELTFTTRTMNATTTLTLVLRSAAAVAADSSVLPAGAKPAAHAGDPLWPVLAAVNRAADAPARARRAEAVRFANDALKARRPLDAFLGLLEHGLESGEMLNDEIRNRRDAFNRDVRFQAYGKAREQDTKPAAEKSLARNLAIDRTGLIRAHMLDLQRANLLERAGRPGEAIGSYFKVLQANPRHAGALHDLGAVYARGFEPQKAWLCWDAARRLYPNHFMLANVAEVERRLLRSQPDFF